MRQATGAELPPSARVAGYLAVLYGFLGVFAGASGAFTFLPYRVQNNQTVETAAAVTAISALGAAVSLVGVLYGWRLLRNADRARRASLGVAAGCVTAVAAFALVTPPSTPSPVPGGPSAYVFLAVVAGAYGLEVLLLMLGLRPKPWGSARVVNFLAGRQARS